MKKSQFVRYHVVGRKNIGTDKDPKYQYIRCNGVVKDTIEKLGKIFRQNTSLCSCTAITEESYEPIYY